MIKRGFIITLTAMMFQCALAIVATAVSADQSELNTMKSGLDIQESKLRCPRVQSEAGRLYIEDFRLPLTFAQMRIKFDELYDSGKRLPMHSTFDKGLDQFYLHLFREQHFRIPVTEQFISNVVHNVEQAIQSDYANFVFYSDLGHSHLYFPQKHWNETYRASKATVAHLYIKMLADTRLRPLYHAAEQLQFSDASSSNAVQRKRDLERRQCRNILGSNDGSNKLELLQDDAHPRNTVFEIDGYKRYSAGFQISASKSGCFGYLDRSGKKLYLDIGLTDLQRDPQFGTPCDI